MKKTFKRVIIFCSITILIITVIFIVSLFSLCFPFNKKKAIDDATEYIENKYNKNFQYTGIGINVIDDPRGYTIRFYDKDSDTRTTVSVSPDVSTSDWYDIIVDSYCLNDDYVENYLDNFVGKKLTADMNDSALLMDFKSVGIINSSLRGEKGETLYNLLSDGEDIVDEYLKTTSYLIYFDIKSDFNYAEVDKYAEEISDTLAYLQANGYKATLFCFDYSNNFSINIPSTVDFANISQDETTKTVKKIIEKQYKQKQTEDKP